MKLHPLAVAGFLLASCTPAKGPQGPDASDSGDVGLLADASVTACERLHALHCALGADVPACADQLANAVLQNHTAAGSLVCVVTAANGATVDGCGIYFVGVCP